MRELLKLLMPNVDRHVKNLRAACGNRQCHNTHLMRGIPGGRPGVLVGSTWYCCIDCFAMAACVPLERLCNRQVVEIPRNPRLSLGLFLISKGYVTSEQLRIATAKSQCLGDSLEETLVIEGMVTEKQLVAARSAQWGYPMLSPDFVGQMVEIDIPKTIMKACAAVPLHYSSIAKKILVGFASRVDHRFLELVEEMTHCRVEPCFITADDFQEQLQRVTLPRDYEEIVIDNSGSPEKMARTVGRAAVQVAAREAAFSQWRNFVLVRMTGKRGRADVIFNLVGNAGAGVGEESVIFRHAIAI